MELLMVEESAPEKVCRYSFDGAPRAAGELVSVVEDPTQPAVVRVLAAHELHEMCMAPPFSEVLLPFAQRPSLAHIALHGP